MINCRISLFLALLFAGTAHASTTALDASFGVGGVQRVGGLRATGMDYFAYAVTYDANGAILVAGRGESVVADCCQLLPTVARFHPDGTWDTGFATNGLFILPSSTPSIPVGGEIHNVRSFSDGRILAVGGRYSASAANYDSCTLVMKLTTSGTLDPTFGKDHSGSFCFDFGPPAFYYYHLEGVFVDSDDTFYVTTYATSLDHGAVAHFDANGILLATYGNNGIASLPVGIYASLIERVAGNELQLTGIRHTPSDESLATLRLDATGQLDESYGSGGVHVLDTLASPGVVLAEFAATDAQGRLVVAVDDTPDNNILWQPFRIGRITPSGADDLSFNSDGQQSGPPGFGTLSALSGQDNLVVAAHPLPDGHILVIGSTHTGLALARLNGDASYDASFGDANHPGWWTSDFAGSFFGYEARSPTALDGLGHLLIATKIGRDANGQPCPALIRLIPDRIFNDGLEADPVPDTCPP